MRISDSWKDYELIDCSSGERLERWGEITLIRPDPQVIWQTKRAHPLWRKANARYLRSSSGGGRWEVYGGLPDVWQISYHTLRFNIKTMGFKHTGLFPEQAVNWNLVRHVIRSAGRPVKVLNLFAYTAAQRSPAWRRAPRWCMWMPPRAWLPGRRRMRQPPGWQAGLCAGLLTTALSSSSVKFAAAIAMISSSWTRPPMGVAVGGDLEAGG